MARELVPDALWARVAPLLPPRWAHPQGGRPFCNDRACLGGILFVLRTGVAWRDLPAEIFGCSGVTCWRQLPAWHRAGVWEALQQQLRNELGRRRQIDWSRVSFDASSVRAQTRGPAPAGTRQPAASRARNTTSSVTGRGVRSRRGCRPPTSTTSAKPSRCSTPSRR